MLRKGKKNFIANTWINSDGHETIQQFRTQLKHDAKSANDPLCQQMVMKFINEAQTNISPLNGIQNRELAWFKSYLTNRKQFARVNGADSKIEEIDIGVPQGSCLGPQLFLVYINDLSVAIKNSKTPMYADDTSIYCCSKDMPQLNKEINEDIEKLDEWLIGNKLSLNVAKTHSMLIASQQKDKSLSHSDIRFEPKIREEKIEIRSKAKYLGVQTDDHLNWKEHTRAVSAKVSRAIGFLKYAKQYLPITAVKTLYTSNVEPHFQYCCSVWGCCSAAEIQH